MRNTTKRKMLMLIIGTLAIVLLAGCNKENMKNIDLSNINNITIVYNSEDITFIESDEDDLIIKEYLSEWKSSYEAKVSVTENSVNINVGKRPLVTTFGAYVEIYLPKTYSGNLTVETTSGKISMDAAYSFDAIHIKSTSGNLESEKVSANTIDFITNSGEILCHSIYGHISTKSNSGRISVSDASGAGNYESNSGEIELEYIEIGGDITVYSQSGGVYLTMPKDSNFIFDANTHSGNIRTTFPEFLASTETTANGMIGDEAGITIDLSTSSGNIEVTR
ncbi:DUF4097 family beta strand repeat-containing protein [Amphibacillus sediminis]|uniref:DUF4097 family beta strand repeat-containing protein n=1 Tax=Amphibacillus sediminis TaxID=360185 RepID=UPI00082C88AB|nr:DUF4097 family beta strand repeat-containing protein [Amphibacillus sediminis]